MARLLRFERAGAWYYATTEGVEGRPIFRTEEDRQHFLELLGRMAERFRCRIYAYVLLNDHFHLLLETTEPNLSRALHWLNVRYTIWFGVRHHRRGHVVQGRFKALIVEPKSWALRVSRYLHLNPARLGTRRRRGSASGEALPPREIKSQLKRLRQFRWSSYAAYTDAEEGPSWLDAERVLALGFGPSPKKRPARYRDYCEAALQTGLSDRIWENRVGRLVLGSADFYKRMMKAGKGEQPKRPNWKQVIALVEQLKGERWKDFRDRYGDWGRDFALTLGREVGGLRLEELRALGGLRSIMSVSASLERFTRKRLDADKSLSQLMSAAKARLWKGVK